MTEPLILSQLREKRAEIEGHIESLSARLANARADLMHVTATMRMFDPSPVDEARPVSYHGSTRALKRSELFDRCKAAMDAATEPLSTRELARAVILAEGWDNDDRSLKLSVAHRIGNLMGRYERRRIVESVGKRGGVTVWRVV